MSTAAQGNQITCGLVPLPMNFCANRDSLSRLAEYTALLFILLLGALFQTSCERENEPWQILIQNPHSGIVYHETSVEKETILTLSYRHSVSRSPVQGTFLITETGKIKPLTTAYSSFGPGLPMDYMESYTIEEGLVTVYHEEEPRDSIRLWVSPQTEETLFINEQEYPLAALTDSHLLLDISVKTNSWDSKP